MPYFNELDVENTRPYSAYGQSYGTVLNYRFGTSFRNLPKAQFNVPCPDQLADPYAWFITSVMEARMNANHVPYLQDRGHAWHSETHRASVHNFSFLYRGTEYPIRGGYLYPLQVPAQGLFYQPPQYAMSVPPSDDLSAFGQQAIARCRPTPSTFSGAQFLGELREGLPKLAGAALIKGRVKDIISNAGSEYLNIQFGWKPLMSDLKSLVTTVLALDAVLAKKRTDMGIPKKAKFSLPPTLESQEIRYDGQFAVSNLRLTNRVLPSGLQPVMDRYTSDGVTNLTFLGKDLYYLRTVKRRRSFEGMFTSFFDYPPPESSWVEKAKSLLLQDYTPEVLWELAPWSWLVDWVFHIQNSIQANAVASDKRIVMNYGYVMESLRYSSLFTGRIPDVEQMYPVRYINSSFSVSTTDVVKRRIRANPFGLQVTNPGMLNADQVSILAALGASWRR